MTKARRMIEDSLKQVDMAVEILDARIPLSSRNPDIAPMLAKANRPGMIILNKSDLADPAENEKWLSQYKKSGIPAILFNARATGAKATAEFTAAVKTAYAEKAEKNAARGMVGRAIKIMVLGIPNVGKSTVINCLCGSKRAKAEDRPGVTRGKQWISAQGLDILDTPGILWPKIDDKSAAEKLAVTGAIRDEILDCEELAVSLLDILKNCGYMPLVVSRYKITEKLPESSLDLLSLIGKKRGFVVSGGHIDTERAASVLLDEFRGGKIGRITLDRSGDNDENQNITGA